MRRSRGSASPTCSPREGPREPNRPGPDRSSPPRRHAPGTRRLPRWSASPRPWGWSSCAWSCSSCRSSATCLCGRTASSRPWEARGSCSTRASGECAARAGRRDAAGCCGCGLAPHLLNFTSITVGAVRGADAPNPAGVLSGTGNPSGSAGFSSKQQRKCRKHEAVIPLGEFHRGVLHRHWAFLERTFIKLS